MTGLRAASVEIEVPFHDLDPAGIVWHGNYARYFEVARCALLETIQYNYDEMFASGFMWPVVDLRVRYVQMIRFKQRIRVTATLREWEYRLLVDYLIVDAMSGQRLTKGSSVQVAVDMKTKELCLMSPRILLDKLGLPATDEPGSASAAGTGNSQ